MLQEGTFGRNKTEIFAGRVLKNLRYIMGQRKNGADVHEVTQLAVSLLGLVVFPWEKGALERARITESERLRGQKMGKMEYLQE